MTRYTTTTAMGRSESAAGLTHRVVDTKGSDGNVAICPTVAYCTAEAEARNIADALNESEQRAKAQRPDGIDAQGMGEGRTLVVQPKNHRAPR